MVQGRPEDEVDRIVAAWARERPNLDVTPLTVLSRVSRLARHLDLARRGAFSRHDLETWEFDVPPPPAPPPGTPRGGGSSPPSPRCPAPGSRTGFPPARC